MEFSKQEYWSGYPLPSLGDLPDPGIKPGSPALQANSLPSELPEKPMLILAWLKKIVCMCKGKRKANDKQNVKVDSLGN